MPNYRKIIHIDMDAFFASVEQRDDPELRGKPIAVGHDSERSVVSTASYEARKYGVRSAMPMITAKKRCPKLVIVNGNYDKYKEVSEQVHAIFHEYTDIIEPISLDEAFLDVTENKMGMELATDIAKEIKAKIKAQLNLTASAGVSYNKFLAKIASDVNKPDGICVVHPEKALEFISKLPIEKFWGVGKQTAKRMHYMGIFTGRQLRDYSLNRLTMEFGKQGELFYNFARGIDPRPVVAHRIRKSVGCERTLHKNLTSLVPILIELHHIAQELVERIAESGFSGHTLTLKVKYGNFSQITRSITTATELKSMDIIYPAAKELLKLVTFNSGHAVRLIGLSVGTDA